MVVPIIQSCFTNNPSFSTWAAWDRRSCAWHRSSGGFMVHGTSQWILMVNKPCNTYISSSDSIYFYTIRMYMCIYIYTSNLEPFGLRKQCIGRSVSGSRPFWKTARLPYIYSYWFTKSTKWRRISATISRILHQTSNLDQAGMHIETTMEKQTWQVRTTKFCWIQLPLNEEFPRSVDGI